MSMSDLSPIEQQAVHNAILALLSLRATLNNSGNSHAQYDVLKAIAHVRNVEQSVGP